MIGSNKEQRNVPQERHTLWIDLLQMLVTRLRPFQMYNTSWYKVNYPDEVKFDQVSWTSTQLAVKWLRNW